jgi:signal transduction histidine kinase
MQARGPAVAVDILLALVLTGLSVATVIGRSSGPIPWPAAVLAVLSVAPIALRQLAPVATMGVVVVALAAYATLGYGDFPSGAVGMVVALFTVATLRSRPIAALMFAATVGVSLLTRLTVDDVTWPLALQAMLVCLGAWILGESTRRWARRAEEAAADAEHAVAEERTRIARELHDVVSHHLSVVALHTGVAGYVWATDSATARRAVATAENAARDALGDLARMLEALRPDTAGGGTASYAPQPGLRDVDALVDRLCATGLEVTVARSGSVRELSPGAELCAYRMLQESLTNVLKHAGPGATARLLLTYADHTLTAEVVDDGATSSLADQTSGTRQHSSGTRQGIRGMRERAELYGGVLEAGPLLGGGYAVRLRLPVPGLVDEAALLEHS